MGATKIADIIVPEVFNPYVVEKTAELSALVQSGIVARSAEFDTLASAPSKTVHLPFFTDLTGEDEVLSDTGALTPDKIGTALDEAVILRRGRAWGVNDLAAALSGDDPMREIGDLVALYWARRMQAALISSLKGVFAAASMAGNVHDISALEAGSCEISGGTFVDAVQKLGDAKEKLTAVAMHSAVEAYLAKQDLIDTLPTSEGKPGVRTYMGKQVIVDDTLPVAAGVYTSFIFGAGAVAYGNGSPSKFVPTETDRDSLQGEDYLINRKTWVLHPRGVAFQSAVCDGSSPENDELEVSSNWKRVYENKNIRIVAFKHKIA